MNIILFQILRQQSYIQMQELIKTYGEIASEKTAYQEALKLWRLSCHALREYHKEVDGDSFWKELASIGIGIDIEDENKGV